MGNGLIHMLGMSCDFLKLRFRVTCGFPVIRQGQEVKGLVGSWQQLGARMSTQGNVIVDVRPCAQCLVSSVGASVASSSSS